MAFQGYFGGPYVRTNGSVDAFPGVQNPMGAQTFGKQVSEGVQDANRMHVGPLDGGISDQRAMSQSVAGLIPEVLATAVYKLTADVQVHTCSRNQNVAELARLLTEVFGYTDSSALVSDDTQAILRELLELMLPQLEESTAWTSPGREVGVRHSKTVAKMIPYEQNFRFNQLIENTRMGNMILAGVSVGMARLVMEKCLFVVFGLTLTKQVVPREFNARNDKVSFTAGFAVTAAIIGCCNTDTMSVIPFLKKHADAASGAMGKAAPDAVIVDGATRDIIHIQSGDNYKMVSGDVSGAWNDQDLLRGKNVGITANDLYKFPLVTSPKAGVSALSQTAIVWHYLVLKGVDASDPITDFTRNWTGTDTADSFSASKLIESLCCFDSTGKLLEFRGVNEDAWITGANGSGSDNRLTKFRQESALFDENGNAPTCIGDVKARFLADSDIANAATGAVQRNATSAVAVDNAIVVLEKYLSKADRGGLVTLADFHPEDAAGDVQNALVGTFRLANLRGPIAGGAGADDQLRLFVANPAGLSSYSGMRKYVELLAFALRMQESYELTNALDVFAHFCDTMNKAMNVPFKDAQDPTGNDDFRNIFYLLAVARNHTPVFWTGSADQRDTVPGGNLGVSVTYGALLADHERNLIKEGLNAIWVTLGGNAGIAFGAGASAAEDTAALQLLGSANRAGAEADLIALRGIFGGASFVGAEARNTALTTARFRILLLALAHQLVPAQRASLASTFAAVDPVNTHADTLKLYAREVASKLIAHIPADRHTVVINVVKNITNMFIDQLAANVVPTHGYQEPDGGRPHQAQTARTGFVVSWTQMRNHSATIGNARMHLRPAAASDHSTAGIAGAITRDDNGALDALVNSIRGHNLTGGAPVNAATFANPIVATAASSTDLSHRQELLKNSGAASVKIATLCYMFAKFTKQTLIRLFANKIALPLFIGAFFPVQMIALPVIMLLRGAFGVFSKIADAHVRVNPEAKTNVGHIRALITSLEHPGACSYVCNFAHITGFGETDKPQACQPDFIRYSHDPENYLGFISFLFARQGRPAQRFINLLGTHNYAGVPNNFGENQIMHYDTAPHTVKAFKLSPSSLSITGQVGFFGAAAGQLNHVTAAIPVSYQYITAEKQTGTVESGLTFGSVPIGHGNLSTKFLGYKPQSAGAIFQQRS